tara:strand:+ start:3435 stop:3815 length:381 start_codon:yes stop_codon:yes gene_type:complete
LVSYFPILLLGGIIMSKMGQHFIGLIEEGKVYEDHNGELIMSEETYPIEKGLEVPKSVTNQRRWDKLPFEKMEMGDSFVVDELHTKGDEMSLRGRATRENNNTIGKFFSVVKNPEASNSFRVFRVK